MHITFLKEDGSALLTVLAFMLVLTIIGTAFIGNSLTEAKIAVSQMHNVQAYYIAEAGLEIGIAALRCDFGFAPPNGSPLTGVLNGGTYTVTFDNISDVKRKVLSTATYNNVEAIVVAEVELAPLYQDALTVFEKLELEGITINGNIHVNDRLYVKGNKESTINGRLSYTDRQRINIQNSYLKVQKIVDKEQEDSFLLFTDAGQIPQAWQATEIPIPAIDFENFTEHSDIVYDKAYFWSEPPDENKVLFRDNLHIDAEDNFIFDGMIIVDGYVHLDGTFNEGYANHSLIIVAKDSIVIGDSFGKGINVGGKVFLCSEKDIKITSGGALSSWDLTGIIIAPDVALDNGSFTYDTSVLDEYSQYLPEYGIIVSRWSKY
ncbi:MAG: pilus assembly PilX family protein [Dethiobacteria bacterium]|jgi:cytoskeletal protein CcmA (bactofilin family)|nr:hypothetical protein [Bacillota bacterium]